ncbi:MAG: ATP-binding protein [Pseudomonadota bacterium]|nr:ATP-binding protein [Pseudomonadota bacterium]
MSTRRPGLALKLGALLTLGVVAAMLLSSAFTRAYDGSGDTAWVALALGVALASALVFAAVLDWLVVRPLVRLARQVRRMETADLAEPFVATGIDEPRELGEALERLRRRVLVEQERQKQLNEDLEARVRERTEALAAAQRELSDAERLASVGRLAGGVAHEINNPAGVILGRASYLRTVMEETGGDPEQIADLAVMERQAERIRQITGSLLRFARKSTGERRAVDLADVARDAIALARLEARARGIDVKGSLRPAPVRADPHALEQVAYNLLRNAVHAARSTVHVRTGPDGLVVEDDGAGIPAEHLPRVFEPFFTTKAPGEGTGLGLAVVHGIVTEHGGRIVAENVPGSGARLHVTLPAA